MRQRKKKRKKDRKKMKKGKEFNLSNKSKMNYLNRINNNKVEEKDFRIMIIRPLQIIFYQYQQIKNRL